MALWSGFWTLESVCIGRWTWTRVEEKVKICKAKKGNVIEIITAHDTNARVATNFTRIFAVAN